MGNLLLIGALVGVRIVAVSTTIDLSSWIGLAQYGVLGVVVVALVVGKIVPGYAMKASQEENQRLRDQLDQLRTKVEEQALPALIRTTDLLTRLTDESIVTNARRRRAAGS